MTDALPIVGWLRLVARQEGSTGKPFSSAADTIEDLYGALFDYLHAVHPASQKACAAKAREALAKARAA